MESKTPNEKFYKMTLSSVYPHYIRKAEKKGRTKVEVDEIICWLTGFSRTELDNHLEKKTNFKDFFENAPQIHPNVYLIKGMICGYRVEDIEDPVVKNVRYLDKLIDELAKGKPMIKILRN